MKFTTLKIQNFLSLESANIQLADRGLVLIQGVNEDNSSAQSNGSGKSSIADALCWCLYGSTARGVSGDAVVNRAAGTDAFVSLAISDGTDRYLVARYRKHKTHKNSLHVVKVGSDGTELALTKGTDKLTQDLVNSIIGCSYEVFRAAVYAGQESMPDLPAMTDKQLKILVEEAAGVTLLEQAYTEARYRYNTNIDGLKTNQDVLERLKKDREDDEARRKIYEVKSLEFVEQLEEDLKNLSDEVDTYDASIAKVQEWIDAIDEAATNDKIADLEHKIASVEGERKKERELEAQLRKAELELRDATNLAKSWRAGYDTAKIACDRVGEIVGTECKECGKPYCEEDVAVQRKMTANRVKEIKERAPEIKQSVEDAKERVASAQAALDVHRASMTDVSETAAQITPLNAILAKLKGHRDELRKWSDLKARTEASIKKKLAETNPFADLLKETVVRLSAKKTLVDHHEILVSDWEHKLRVSEAAMKVFSPSGVRAHILDEVTPFLNDQTAKYLASLTDGNTTATWSTLVRTAKGELREKFSIEVSDITGGESFEALSGGEKRKVRIASALALQDLVARRATKPIELFIGDEIDDALDEAGLERLTGILEERARERGSVFIISHNDIKDWAPATITVVKSKGKSVVIDEVAS